MIATAIQAAALTFERIDFWCTGQICLYCDRPIEGHGQRFTCLSATTHAHQLCAPLLAARLEEPGS